MGCSMVWFGLFTHTNTHTRTVKHSHDLCNGLVVPFGLVAYLKSFGLQFWFFNILRGLKSFFNILEATCSQLFPRAKQKEIKTYDVSPTPSTEARPWFLLRLVREVKPEQTHDGKRKQKYKIS